MKDAAAVLGLLCAGLIVTLDAAPYCCSSGSSCGNYNGGQCCPGLTCASGSCVAAEYPFPAIGAEGFPYYGYYGGFGYTGPYCVGCNSCGCGTCNGCGCNECGCT